ncbi:ABC transporter ATP-binding protein [Streptomyces polygonati]|uniref:ABC transporter ATP-binding protein n=1 Tax=Streptomyces polygonati TaxID=1617087 RepID=A0ABV8HV80_9ACTN
MIRQLLRALGPEDSGPLKRLLILLTAAAVLQGVAFALLVPLLRTLLGPDPHDVWPWLAALGGCSAGYLAVQAACLSSGFTVGSGLARALHHRLADTALALPVGWFTPGRAAELGSLASGSVIQLMNVPAHLLRPCVAALLTPATLAVATFFFDWRVAVALLASAPVLAAVYIWSTSVVQRLDQGRDTASREAADRVLEFARSQPVLRAFGRAAEGYTELDDALLAQARADRALIVRGTPGLVTFAFAARMVLALILALTVERLLDGSLTAPTLIALAVLAARFVDAVSAAGDLGAGLRTAQNSLERLNSVLGEKPFPQPFAGQRPADASVLFSGVTFAYPSTDRGSESHPSAPVLDAVTLRLPAPGVTALVGPSGAGKTTVARLLARFFDATEGTVAIGGVDVRDIHPDQLTAMVSFVFQDVFLFGGTIEDNVRLGDPAATDEQLRRAAALAGLDRVVTELPDGWATRVGEGGTALSGGQRQRVSIARAVLKDAPILVLDEATAALDPENESVVDAAVSSLAHEKTLLVIAHRLRTVQTADQILVLEDGRITERGTHRELLAAGGTYTAFWQQRTTTEGWRLGAAS